MGTHMRSPRMLVLWWWGLADDVWSSVTYGEAYLADHGNRTDPPVEIYAGNGARLSGDRFLLLRALPYLSIQPDDRINRNRSANRNFMRRK